MRQIQLQRKPWTGWQAERASTRVLVRSLPFFQTASGKYIHRVRSANMHLWDGQPKHTALSLWCGMTGFLGGKRAGSVFADPPLNGPLCATCEGRAIGAGQTESRLICGRVVKFSPRS